MLKRIHFQALPVTDVERALAFYRDKVGMTVERNEAYGDSRWVFLKIADSGTLLHLDRVERVATTDMPVLILVADDCDATCVDLASKGVEILEGPKDAPWEQSARWAYVLDSEGNKILIQSVKE
jgi:predicted enzyme related to lactoylglutathione lyase